MALSDQLNELLNLPIDHPAVTQLLSLLPAVGGAVMQARRGGNTRWGAPIGAGLSVLGEYGLAKGEEGERQARETNRNKSLSQLLATVTDKTKLTDLLAQGGKSGADPGDVIAGYQALEPQAKTAAPVLMTMPDGTSQYVEPTAGMTLPKGEAPYQKPSTADDWTLVNEAGTAPYEVNKRTGQTRPVRGAPTRGFAPEKPDKGSFIPLTDSSGAIIGAWNPAEGSFVPPPIAGARKSGIKAPGKPWTTTDALKARSKAMSQATAELSTPNKLLPGVTKPTPQQMRGRMKQILLAEGLDEYGKPLKAGATITVP